MLLSILVTWLLLAPRSKCLPSVSTSKSKCLSFLPHRGISRGGSKSWEGAVEGGWEQLIILKILVHETRYMWLVGLTDSREGFLDASIRINSTRINLLYIVTFCGNIAYFVLVICFSPLSLSWIGAYYRILRCYSIPKCNEMWANVFTNTSSFWGKFFSSRKHHQSTRVAVKLIASLGLIVYFFGTIPNCRDVSVRLSRFEALFKLISRWFRGCVSFFSPQIVQNSDVSAFLISIHRSFHAMLIKYQFSLYI